MIGAYCNMSVPPCTKVKKRITPVGNMVAFDLVMGAKAPADATSAELASWMSEFVKEHRAELDAVKRPAGYMIALSFPHVDGSAKYPPGYGMCLCRNPVLTVAVLGRMSGGIYIPRRDLSLSRVMTENLYAFPYKFFPQYEDRS